MITNLFEDDQSQHFQVDFQSSLGTCDAYIFGDVDLLYEDSQPPSSSILEEYRDVAISERSEVQSTKRKYFHIEDFYRDSQMKRPHFSFSRPEVVPYHISSSPRSHAVFFRSLISSQTSTSSGYLCMNEDEPLYIYDSPFSEMS
jgi:hypothetical protein